MENVSPDQKSEVVVRKTELHQASEKKKLHLPLLSLFLIETFIAAL